MSKIKVFKGGTLFDGTGNPLIENSVVVMEDDKFGAVGKVGEVQIPEGPNVEEIDTTGKFVMPGLIESHMHTSLDCSEGKHLASMALEMDSHELMMRNIKVLTDTYKMGYTTIRDGGSGWNWMEVALREGFKRGDVPGPRFLTTGYHLTVSGGHGNFLPPHLARKHRIMESAAMHVDGADEWRKAARINLWHGVDNLKVVAGRSYWTHAGHFEATTSQPTLDELKAVVEVAKTVGIPVMSHANGREAILKSIQAGVDIIVHGYFMDEELASMMAEKGMYWEPTNSIQYNVYRADYRQLPQRLLDRYPFDPKLHDPVADAKELACWKNKSENFMKIVNKTGVKVLVGTDAGCPWVLHGLNAMEMETDVHLGMKPWDALIATTKTAAESMHLEDEIGSVEKGKCADLVVIDGNPLEDISILQEESKIKMVYHNGNLVIAR